MGLGTADFARPKEDNIISLDRTESVSTTKFGVLLTIYNRESVPMGGGGGAHVKIFTGMLVPFFGFEIWPNPIFLGWPIF